MAKGFYKEVVGDGRFLSHRVDIEADDYFITVETDRYEGCAMFHVSLIDEVIEQLKLAKAHVMSTKRKGDMEETNV